MKTQLLVLAAGMGSRFGGVKQVEGVGPRGETVLEYSVYAALGAGFDEVIFLIRASIEPDFRRGILSRLPSWVKYKVAYQETGTLLGRRDAAAATGRRKPWGTGHALLCAAPLLDSPFAVINADDSYGPEAFGAVHDTLVRGECCMAGYRLSKVTSEFGPVSRGICALDAEGFLTKVTEHTSIISCGEPGPDCFVTTAPDGTRTRLPGDSLVSMNLWGLLPSALPEARALFDAFLQRHRDSLDAECYLPSIVDQLTASGSIRVRVLPTEEIPFGLTYRADGPGVRARIEAEIARGTYPDPLWSRRPARESVFAALRDAWRGRGMPELFDLAATEHAALFEDLTLPWDILAGLERVVADMVASMPEPRILSDIPAGVTIEGDVYIGPDCRIEPGAFIRGPAWIGSGCEIRQGAYLRGAVLAAAGAVLGHASEFKRCILLEGAQAPHFNYVGDSVLGIGAHIGAGVILSNFRLDHAPVVVRDARTPRSWDTGLQKFGALIGDHGEIGCNAVLNPGTVLGARCVALPLSRVKGLWPEESRLP